MRAGIASARSRVEFTYAARRALSAVKIELIPTIRLSRLITSNVFFFSSALMRLARDSQPSFSFFFAAGRNKRMLYFVGISFIRRPAKHHAQTRRVIIQSLASARRGLLSTSASLNGV